MSLLKSALGFSALETIGSRVFDFAILWILLNSLPESDIAKFGLATASIFFFNLVFFAPETALLRNQKEWKAGGELQSHLSAFVSFSFLKLLIHLALFLLAARVFDQSHWLVYAVAFSAITQQIQLAEIARIYMRMELQQRRVAKFELLSKSALCVACLGLLEGGNLETYFRIYFAWSFFIAALWLHQLNRRVLLKHIGVGASAILIWNSSVGFSFWTHFSGILTFYIYNANILFLGAFNAPTEDIALYTAVSKVANLFFVIPMFFQSFVPVVLSNAGSSGEGQFKKLFFANAAFSLAQFAFFAAVGWWLAPIFGLKDPARIWDFYLLGLIINGGILVLNLTRPLSTYLTLKTPPKKVMQLVFFPSAVIASALYSAGSFYSGVLGCAIGSCITYAFMATMLTAMYAKQRASSSTNAGVPL